jgi:hypothetical protein
LLRCDATALPVRHIRIGKTLPAGVKNWLFEMLGEGIDVALGKITKSPQK